jgi:hypothetical protein
VRRATLAAACCALAGCIFEPNVGNVGLSAYSVGWTGYDIKGLPQGEAYGFEVTSGTDTEPEMGPLFFGGMFTVQRINSGPDRVAWEYRAGIRARSSVLDHLTASYPYAVVGSYFGLYEPAGRETSRFGIGVEGGYGARLGLGGLVVDIEFIMSYGLFEAWNNLLSTRFGGAVTMQW